MLTPPVLTSIMRAMVLAWEPDSGIVSSYEFHTHLRAEKGRRGSVGWLTYLSHHRGEVPPLPEAAHVESIEDKGTLVILTPERLSAANAGQISLGRRIQDVLDTRDLLKPVLSTSR